MQRFVVRGGTGEGLSTISQEVSELLEPPMAGGVAIAQDGFGDSHGWALGAYCSGRMYGEHRERESSESEAIRTCEKSCDGLNGHDLGTALGEELPVGVVEQQIGALGPPLGRLGVDVQSRVREPFDCIRQIARARGIGVAKRPPQRGGGAARPKEEADENADAAADRDVFDSREADLPSDGLNDV